MADDTSEKKKPRSWSELKRDVKEALRHLKPAIGLVWEADQSSVLLTAALTVVSAILPVTQAYLGRLIVDSVLASIYAELSARDGLRAVSPYLFGEFGAILAGVLVGQLKSLASQLINQKLSQLISIRIMRKANRLELRYFEDAEFYDKMQNARRQAEYKAVAIINAVFLLVQNTLTIFSFAALIFIFNPWVGLVLFFGALPAFVAQTHFSRLQFRLQSWRAPESRRMGYIEHLLTVDGSAKEIKLFDLAEPLIKTHNDLFWKVFSEDKRVALKQSLASVLLGAFASIAFYGCYAWVILRTVTRTISLGQMTFYLTAFRQLQGTFGGVFDNINKLFENGLFMQNLFSFLELPEESNASVESSNLGVIRDFGVEFKNVSFKYPGQSNWTLKGINLHVPRGQKIALVGENGSGKTTLIKLLTRLYEPTEGEIWLGGRPLKNYSTEELHRKLGVIFQDFVRYQLTLRENIGFGSIENLQDLPRLTRAANEGGAQDLVTSLPDGWDTMLGGWFKKGRELSGGQWQKIALSRAFMRESDIIILDEPTSALDAAKEHEIFQRFKDLTAGKTAFLISHRFSTVRMADQIVVLKEGTIEEQGSHNELMLREGTYARLFEMQAQGYR